MISIILPVYNAEEYIRKCIESIQNQTYENWELIVIDNGSTDNSYDICREYAREDNRIHLYHQYKNKGVSAARNLALEKVSGQYLTFIDADDTISSEYLQTLFKLASENDVDMVVCGYQKTYQPEEESNHVVNEVRTYNNIVYDLENYWDKYLLQGNTHCWGVLFDTKLIDEIHFQNRMTIGEDLLYLLEASQCAKKILVTNYDGYRYYINPKGAMLKKYSYSYMDQLYCWQEAKKMIITKFPELNNKIDALITVAALLVVGKITELNREEQKEYQDDIKQCLSEVKKIQLKKIRKYLPGGYLIKTVIFRITPQIYMELYGIRKRKYRFE